MAYCRKVSLAYRESRGGNDGRAAEAADYALDLCERFGVKATTARTGKFSLVAAALFGDPNADLQYHCRKAISQKRAQK